MIQHLKFKFRNQIEKKKLLEIENNKDILKIKYDKILREINFKLEIIDEYLDKREENYYSSIKEYNKYIEEIKLFFY